MAAQEEPSAPPPTEASSNFRDCYLYPTSPWCPDKTQPMLMFELLLLAFSKVRVE
jgi:hypothetical protein